MEENYKNMLYVIDDYPVEKRSESTVQINHRYV